MKLITTSWDDGHPLDYKIAELLDKYRLQGTFYVPQHNGNQAMMTDRQIARLSEHFEIGGHTLNHVWLDTAHKRQWQSEILGSYNWLTAITGKQPISFCFPGGVYSVQSLQEVLKSGYKQARTTELLNLHSPVNHLVSTSLQVYEHTNLTYARHLAKRARWKRLVSKLLFAPTSGLLKLTEYYLEKIEKEGGCFHLWGHSWEIEQFNLWKKVESLFQLLSERKDFSFIQNRQLLDYNT